MDKLERLEDIHSMKIGAVPSTNSRASQLVAATPRKNPSLGSGFIIDSSRIIVTLQDILTLTAQVIGANPTADIALLKVHAAKPLPAVKLGGSRTLRIGDPVFAIRNPPGIWWLGQRGYSQRAQSRHHVAPIRRLHSDECRDQSR